MIQDHIKKPGAENNFKGHRYENSIKNTDFCPLANYTVCL